eukprot:TRINITY_DN9859_c0_g1_i1.p3 TRINITY_DN9859_c0_g1~~TRINITY_DN9859_c0_g1_i1.p3  ORF type:complete len:54 (-),score=4.87 TRINITY_DN9859_c0_g1_i1:344-505(-)
MTSSSSLYVSYLCNYRDWVSVASTGTFEENCGIISTKLNTPNNSRVKMIRKVR